MPELAWTPGDAELAQSVTARFMAAHGITSYDQLVARSITDPDWFWHEVVGFLGLPFTSPYSTVRNQERGLPWTTWFDHGTINLAAACLDRWADDPHHVGVPALVTESEDGSVTSSSYGELRDEVARLATAISDRGISPGDRVAILAGLDDAVRVFLAVARIGAVAVPIFSGFGAGAVAARLVDARCRLLVASTATVRRGARLDVRAVADAAAAEADDAGVRVEVIELAALAATATLPVAPPHPTRAEDPVLLAYTSGTTGRPKGAVHVHGGLTVKLAQEGAFQCDLQPGDRACWLTDMGWIMGPWITVAALANGATLVTYDGAPDWPDPGRLWSLVERHRLTFLGVSPALIRSLAATGDEHVVRTGPVIPARLRLDRRTVEPRTVVVVVRHRR